jgi:hypothetical protein
MIGLRRRTRDVPSDPLARVLTRTLSPASPEAAIPQDVTGFWLGPACDRAGVRAGTAVDNGTLEDMITEHSGFDIVLAEPIELLRWLAIYGPERDAKWLAKFGQHVAADLPDALAEVLRQHGMPSGDVSFAAAVFVHPVSDCWPVDADVFHAHCIVPGQVWYSTPAA